MLRCCSIASLVVNTVSSFLVVINRVDLFYYIKRVTMLLLWPKDSNSYRELNVVHSLVYVVISKTGKFGMICGVKHGIPIIHRASRYSFNCQQYYESTITQTHATSGERIEIVKGRLEIQRCGPS